MPTDDLGTAERLRARAANLRALARRLNSLLALDLYRFTGSDTWVGPSPQRCDDTMRGVARTLRSHGDSLATHARRLDRAADEVEARARLSGTT